MVLVEVVVVAGYLKFCGGSCFRGDEGLKMSLLVVMMTVMVVVLVV